MVSLPLSSKLERQVNHLRLQLRDKSDGSAESHVQIRADDNTADLTGAALGSTIHFFKLAPHKIASAAKGQWNHFRSGFKSENRH